LPASEMDPRLSRTYGVVATAVTVQGAALARPPFARYHRLAGQPFASRPGSQFTAAIHADGDVASSELPGGPAAEALASWVTRQGGGPAGDPWETYLSNPAREPDPPPGAPRLPSPTTRHEAALLTGLSGTRVTLMLPGRPWGASTWSCHCSRGVIWPSRPERATRGRCRKWLGSPSVSTVRSVLSGLLSGRCARQPSVMLR